MINLPLKSRTGVVLDVIRRDHYNMVTPNLAGAARPRLDTIIEITVGGIFESDSLYGYSTWIWDAEEKAWIHAYNDGFCVSISELESESQLREFLQTVVQSTYGYEPESEIVWVRPMTGGPYNPPVNHLPGFKREGHKLGRNMGEGMEWFS